MKEAGFLYWLKSVKSICDMNSLLYGNVLGDKDRRARLKMYKSVVSTFLRDNPQQVLFRRGTIIRGGLPRRGSLHMEETGICWRVRLSDYTIVFQPLRVESFMTREPLKNES